MRVLTFIYMKSCKFKQLYSNVPNRLYSEIVQVKVPEGKIKVAADPNLVEVYASWAEDDSPELRAAALRDLSVFPEFVSEREEQHVLQELEPVLRRMRYQFDHWDNAIEGYRETERSEWSPESEALLRRVRELAFPPSPPAPPGAPGPPAPPPLPHVHVLDLAPAGYIKPHIDAVRFCGPVIAGLSLCSSAVLVLQHAAAPCRRLAALLPRRSLYVMRGVARYEFSHEVPRGEHSRWGGRGGQGGQRVPRGRRLALITRSRPAPADVSAAPGDVSAAPGDVSAAPGDVSAAPGPRTE